MDEQRVGVYSGRQDLSIRLKETCPTTVFLTEGSDRDFCRVIVVDSDSHSVLASPPRKSLVRVVLCNGAPGADRRKGEVHLERTAFVAAPAHYLGFAADLAETVLHATRLELEVSYLSEVHDMMAMLDADEVSERITRTVLGILGLPHGTLFLHDPRLERYVVSFSNDEAQRETGEFLPGVPPDLLQRALASGQLFAIDRDNSGKGLMIMPLQMREDLLGVIRVPLTRQSVISEEATTNMARYLTTVAQVLSNIYQLTRSRDLAMRDDLTKAYNRRFFESYLDEEIERARRYGTLFSIIFLDLDDLKMVNNFYGHLTGSRTLQEVAKRILTAVRAIDKVVRFGGDEFCIILPQTDQDQAMAVAKRVRKAMTASAFRVDANVEISITASFGIATYPTHALGKEDLVRQADAAMYRVKSTTKNAVGIAVIENATKPAAL